MIRSLMLGDSSHMSEIRWKPLVDHLRRFPWDWDGQAAIHTLKDANYQWKQMEWIGWYFEYLCMHRFREFMRIPGPKHGNVEFDGFLGFPWDFKAHVTKGAKGQAQHSLILNDKAAVRWAIDRYGAFGIVVARGVAEFNDLDRSFQAWHQRLKGGPSAYEKKRQARGAPSRLRKVALEVLDFRLFRFGKSEQSFLTTHRQGRNSDGSPRAPKVQFRLSSLDPVAVVERPSHLPRILSSSP